MKNIILFLIEFVGIATEGWVFKVIYDWYFLETFGFPEITVFHGCGIAFLAFLLMAKPEELKKAERVAKEDRFNKILVDKIKLYVVKFGSVLVWGWLFHFFL